jgi:hypothetical protein
LPVRGDLPQYPNFFVNSFAIPKISQGYSYIPFRKSQFPPANFIASIRERRGTSGHQQ